MPCGAAAGGRRGCCAFWRTCWRSARTRTISSSMPRSARPRATGPRTTKIVETLKTHGRGQTLLIQSGKPIGLLQTHAKAPLVIMANCNIVGQWAKAEEFYELREEPDLLGRAHRRRLAIYRLAGRHSGHLRDLHAHRRAAFRRRSRRPLRPHRRARRHGRRAAAGRHAWRGPRSSASRSTRARIDKRMAIGFLEPRRRSSTTRLTMIRKAQAGEAAAIGRPRAATRPTSIRRSPGAASCPISSPTRPQRTISSTATCRRACRSTRCARCARATRDSLMAGSRRARSSRHVSAMLEFQKKGAEVFDNGNLIRTQAKKGGVDECLRHSDLHRGVSAAAIRARHRPVPLDGAVGRSRRHPQDRRPAAAKCSPTTRSSPTGSSWRASMCRSRVCRRASPGSAMASARSWP